MGAVLAILIPSGTFAKESIRAKIGVLILNDDQSRLAKSRDTLNAGSLLQIHVIPEKNCYLYLINSDDQKATWLNWGDDLQQVPQGKAKVFPSKVSSYAHQGTGKHESFVIVCSPKKLFEISNLFSNRSVGLSQWNVLENQMIKDSRIPLGDNLSKPFGIAGSVRGSEKYGAPEGLMIYSGKSLLVKKYQFNVEK